MTGSHAAVPGFRLVFVATLLFGLLGVVLSGPPSVQAQETGSVTFRLIIEGPVPGDDVFALPRSSSECCFTDPVHVFCGAGIGTSAEPCEARTYEITYDYFSVGTVIDYAYQRWPGGNSDVAETFYAEQVTVQEQAQVISVTYRYTSGVQPTPAPQPTTAGHGTGATPSPPTTVPDTAMGPSAASPHVAWALLAVLLAGLGVGRLVLLRQRR